MWYSMSSISWEIKKVNVYIDWFNLYYALRNKIQNPDSQRKKIFQRCDFRALFSQYLNQDEILNNVYFFTAYTTNKAQKQRHKTYIRALTKYNTKVILGKYQKKTIAYQQHKHTIQKIIYDGTISQKEQCEQCLQLLSFRTFEEKETDVKIALQILQDGLLNQYDHAYIVSWDSDIIPSIQAIKRLNQQDHIPPKTFTSLLIPGTKWQKIRHVCDHKYEFTSKNFENALLPLHITINDDESVSIPQERLE